MQKLHTFYFLKHMNVNSKHKHQGPVVQSWFSINPRIQGLGNKGRGGGGGGVVKPPAVRVKARDPLV